MSRFLRMLASIALLFAIGRCDRIPTYTIRPARPGEVALIRREVIAATVHRRHPEEKSVGLYCPNGIPEISTNPSVGRFNVETNDFDRDVPPIATVVSATVEVRTSGLWVTRLSPAGIDPSYSLDQRRAAEEWLSTHRNAE